MASTNNSNSSGDLSGDHSIVGPIVHVRADSDSTLDDLFAIVTSGTQRPLQVPMKMRNLPPSFWKPPPSGSKSPSCHSRENSVDNTMDPMSPGMQSVGSPQPQQPPSQQPQIFHSRAHSSPATLQQTLAVAQQQNQHLHLRQPSYDVSTPGDNMGLLPQGWEMAKTPQGQVYFMNHITKTTQWEDPRKTMQQQQQQQAQLQQQQQMQQQQQQLAGPPSSPQPPSINAQHLRSNSGSFDNLGPLPSGWEQSVTPEGEMYFINHASKKTTWFDPRIPLQNQRVPIRQPGSSLQQQQQMLDNGNPVQKRQQEVRLQRLENERRALQQRQAELKRQMEQRRSQSHENMQAAMIQTQEMMMRQSLGENTDPFLSTTAPGSGGLLLLQQQQQQSSDLHNRQESADSGVGMGSNFNLGSIPEDLPDDMDSAMDVSTDLDTTLTEQQQQQQQPNSSMDTSSQQQNSLDSTDQLIPSLPVELLPQDIMQDVLGAPTWL